MYNKKICSSQFSEVKGFLWPVKLSEKLNKKVYQNFKFTGILVLKNL